MRGIERRIEAGLDPAVPSVASLFVSRWDVAVADEVPARASQPARDRGRQAHLPRLPRAARLRALAAARQRGRAPAAAAVGEHRDQGPDASDTLYVEALAAPFTINTMPEKTLLALRRPRPGRRADSADGGDAEETLAEFTARGVDVDALAARLQHEGAESFDASWRELLSTIAEHSRPPPEGLVREIRVIAVPHELGGLREGVGRGPERLLARGAAEALASRAAAVETATIELDESFVNAIAPASRSCAGSPNASAPRAPTGPSRSCCRVAASSPSASSPASASPPPGWSGSTPTATSSTPRPPPRGTSTRCRSRSSPAARGRRHGRAFPVRAAAGDRRGSRRGARLRRRRAASARGLRDRPAAAGAPAHSRRVGGAVDSVRPRAQRRLAARRPGLWIDVDEASVNVYAPLAASPPPSSTCWSAPCSRLSGARRGADRLRP